MKFEVDICLVGLSSLLSIPDKANILEDIAKSLGIKYKKYYCDVTDRQNKKQKRSVCWEDYTVIYELECTECYYSFFIYLLNKRLRNIETLNESIR